MRSLRRWHALWLLPLLTMSAGAMAQAGGSPPRSAASPASAAAPAQPTAGPARLSANYFMAQAIQVSEAAEIGLLDGIYASASPIMKAAQGRDAFVAQVRAEIDGTGKATGRDWMSVRREVVPAGSKPAAGAPPPGRYVVVVVIAETAPGRGRYETITFHQDSDNQWRLCGFVAAAVGQPGPESNPQK